MSGSEGASLYLRGWDDYEHHTLKLTAAQTSGLGHFAFRPHSPEALQRRVRQLGPGGPRGGPDRGPGPRPRAALR